MVAPAPSELEKVSEQKVVDYAVARGCLVLKLNVLGRRGWPDRLFIFKGKVFFIEFKRAGEKPGKLQEVIHGRLKQHGAMVYVVDSWSRGIELVNDLTQEDRTFP
jgi:hypothetical protein